MIKDPIQTFSFLLGMNLNTLMSLSSLDGKFFPEKSLNTLEPGD